jgi:predicted chitinase
MASAQITSFNITKTKFENALRNNKYSNQNNQDYSYFMKSLEWAGITSIKEAALFLAHILHETGGLKLMKEDCDPNTTSYNCKSKENGGQEWEWKWAKYNVPNKSYYGRGCLQLSWTCNYYLASEHIFEDYSVLLQDPDRITRDRELCWKTAAWFWKSEVKKAYDMNVEETTKKINSKEVNSNASHEEKLQLEHRKNLYKEICKAFDN